MRRLVLLVAVLPAAACAGAARMAQAPEAAPGEPQAEAKPAAYERILGSFAVRPETAVLLDPVMCAEHLDADIGHDGLQRIAERFRAIQDPRGEAAARLNLGAVLWYGDAPERAYVETMNALNLFAELGDVDGLAHSYEWLGFYFRESGAIDRAAEHFAMSHRLYEMLGNRSASERVLSYAE